MKQIVIIGAGAAGLMAAATILESQPSRTEASNFHVHLFEKNISPGKKVIISGGGRCNVTTAIEDKKILATKYVRGWEFIRKAMGRFSPRKCYLWFESHGVPLKIQEDMRVFPVSDDGRDIVGVFEDIFVKYRDKITLHYGEGVFDVSVIPARPLIHEVSLGSTLGVNAGIQSMDSMISTGGQGEEKYRIATLKGLYEADILVITTGGNAYSHTGSTGDGYAFARALGHTVTPLGPSLSSFLTGDEWLHEFSGLAFEDASIVIPARPLIHEVNLGSTLGVNAGIQKKEILDSGINPEGQKQQKTLTGPLLLTHFGISGPLAFMASSHLAFEDIGKGKNIMIQLAPIADMTREKWDEFLRTSFAANPKKILANILTEKLPRRFVEGFVSEHFPLIRETFVGSIGRKEREAISKLLGEGIPMTLLERRPGDEFVTAGGISTLELDPETMESGIHANLYFAGEVLDVDGYTGGFSLQLCWASGYAVGKNIS